ncbi:MAG: tetratricopeptide repeat protein [Candidatus Omnitrophica bacterium]|nr:tetratricopeptide repeat protein [Candidatus Omnitrophota bacterium]MDD5430143.1 tetratricopeptide repeat protein [Candidatus Omnitrophota bacterium]
MKFIRIGRIVFLIIAIGGILASSLAMAQNSSGLKQLFYKGNRFYKEAKYEEAITAYKEIIDKGYESGSLYYNLGNCFFKKGEFGRAIAYYEKAKLLMPQDRDLEANYRHVKSLVQQQGSGFEKYGVAGALERFYSRFTINGMTVFLFLLYLTAVLLAIVFVIIKIPRLYFGMGIFALTAVFILTFFMLRERSLNFGRQAIVASRQVQAKFEPFERATTYFTLSEGVKVKIISRNDGWCKIKRNDGKIGWVRKEQLQSI